MARMAAYVKWVPCQKFSAKQHNQQGMEQPYCVGDFLEILAILLGTRVNPS